MGWISFYVVLGTLFAAVVSVIADKLHAAAGTAAVITGLVWPIIVVGAAQMALWTAAAELARSARQHKTHTDLGAGAGAR